MKRYIAFYNEGIDRESDKYIDSDYIPVGAIVRYQTNDATTGVFWYVITAVPGHNGEVYGHVAMGINEADVPPWVRGYLLIL